MEEGIREIINREKLIARMPYCEYYIIFLNGQIYDTALNLDPETVLYYRQCCGAIVKKTKSEVNRFKH